MLYDTSLYPPIFSQAYMPAFETSATTCRIYFEISDLNLLSELNQNAVQVSIREQKTNQSALKTTYQNDIIIKSLQKDNSREGKDKYYITINCNKNDANNSDLQNKGFKINEYYKVQIRFTGINAAQPPAANTPAFGSWLSNNLQYFSEWSSVVLIRCVDNHTLTLKINGDETTANYTTSSDYVIISGDVNFNNSSSSERLESYKVQLLKNGVIIEDSGDIYVEDNQFYYIIKSILSVGVTYSLRVFFTTNNLLQFSSINRTIRRTSSSSTDNTILLQESTDNETGYVKLKIIRNVSSIGTDGSTLIEYYAFDPKSGTNMALVADESVATFESSSGDTTNNINIFSTKNGTATFDNYWEVLICNDSFNQSLLDIGEKLTVRRASSKTNFEQWSLLDNLTINISNLQELYWYDYTAEPGIWYRYQIIRTNNQNTVTTLETATNKPVMLDTEDIFLNADGEELIIRFDPSISNVTNKIAESVIDTIGSQYPFFRRNGNINYKTFSLSGTISCFMDVNKNVFHSSPEELYGDAATFYKKYNKEHNIDLYNDFIYEKFFRQKAMEFLQSSDVKLLRSMTEGNILVKLSNITFTPNQTLGRRIYNFSCTVYEVADCNEENYLKFNIIKDNAKQIAKNAN